MSSNLELIIHLFVEKACDAHLGPDPSTLRTMPLQPAIPDDSPAVDSTHLRKGPNLMPCHFQEALLVPAEFAVHLPTKLYLEWLWNDQRTGTGKNRHRKIPRHDLVATTMLPSTVLRSTTSSLNLALVEICDRRRASMPGSEAAQSFSFPDIEYSHLLIKLRWINASSHYELSDGPRLMRQLPCFARQVVRSVKFALESRNSLLRNTRTLLQSGRQRRAWFTNCPACPVLAAMFLPQRCPGHARSGSRLQTIGSSCTSARKRD